MILNTDIISYYHHGSQLKYNGNIKIKICPLPLLTMSCAILHPEFWANFATPWQYGIFCKCMFQKCVRQHFLPDTNRLSVTHQPAGKEVASIPDLTKHLHLPCPALANHHTCLALPWLTIIPEPALPWQFNKCKL